MKTKTKSIELVAISKSGQGESKSVKMTKDTVVIDNVESVVLENTFESRVKKSEEFQEKKRAAKAVSVEALIAVKIEERKWLESIAKMLEPEFKKNGFMYRLVKRGEKALIYSQHNIEDGVVETSPCAHEVFVSRISSPKIAFKKPYEAYEMFPGNSVFGIWAWSCMTIDKAQEHFSKIEKSDIVEEETIEAETIEAEADEEADEE